MTNREEIYGRGRASLYGLAIGDALGATTEFMLPREIKAKYGVHRKIIGGGWLYLKPGQVTDDTEMSLCIARAILDAGEWDLVGVADQFVTWMKNKPVDMGATVRKGIRKYMLQGELKTALNEWDAGNGAVMRMAPVALYSLGDDELLERCALEQAWLTHNHPYSDAGCLTVGKMVQAAIFGADRVALHELTRDLVAEHPKFNFNRYNDQASGYVVDTLRTVFHYLFTTATFEECLIGVVNQGGDADTTGAIAGMIAGAHYGIESIPKRWIKRLSKKVKHELDSVAPQLLDLSPWAEHLKLKEIMKMEKTEETIPLDQAALQLQTTPLNLLMHIKRGLIKATEIDGVWMVCLKSLESFAAENNNQKAADLCSSGCSKADSCGSHCS
jgi:ADP-ribosyl-[dinitrogen reductase] hydrolase